MGMSRGLSCTLWTNSINERPIALRQRILTEALADREITFAPDWINQISYHGDFCPVIPTWNVGSKLHSGKKSVQRSRSWRGRAKLFLSFHSHTHTRSVKFVQKLIYTFSFHLLKPLHVCKLECIWTFAPSESFVLLFYCIHESLQTCQHILVWCVNIVLKAHKPFWLN